MASTPGFDETQHPREAGSGRFAAKAPAAADPAVLALLAGQVPVAGLSSGEAELADRLVGVALEALGEETRVVWRGEPDLETLLEHGGLFDEAEMVVSPGRPSACHENVAGLVDAQPDIGVGTGYALSDDGLWRQHSWGVGPDGQVVETTTPRRLYWGVRLEGEAAGEFVVSNL